MALLQRMTSRAAASSSPLPEAIFLQGDQQPLRQLYTEQIDAGADIIITNTFNANPIRLEPFQLHADVNAINTKAMEIAATAAQEQTLIAASIGPAAPPTANLTLSQERLLHNYQRQIESLSVLKPDFYLIDGMTSLTQARVAVQVACAQGNAPVILTMMYREDTTSFDNSTPEELLDLADAHSVYAVGSSCGFGPVHNLKVLQQLQGIAAKPRPLVFLPGFPNPHPYTDLQQSYSQAMRCGAKVVGGCCGTTLEMLRYLRSVVTT